MSCQQIVKPLLLSQFMAKLAQTGSQILDTLSEKLAFSITVVFNFTKTEIFRKNNDNSKIQRVLVLYVPKSI